MANALMSGALALAGARAVCASDVEIAGLRAQPVGPFMVAEPSQGPAYGTSTASVRTIHALAFQESDSGMTFSYDNSTTQRFRTGGSYLWFDAPLADLPAGAQLVGLELEGCDTSTTQQVLVGLFRRGSPGGPTDSLGSLGTGAAATPGCAFFGSASNLPGDAFVDNRNSALFVRVELGATDNTTSFGAVRVYFTLRVSPAPAVATFPNDVPTTHPFFQFIEALAASGVTHGCGAGSYCPDAAVTRGQMAVFLAVALGMHFPY